MDQHSPDYYIENTAQSLEDTEMFTNYVLDKSNSLVTPVITPRFAPSCITELMKGLDDLAAKYNLPVQSHMDENMDEITRIKKIHPKYERQLIKRRGAGISHCPDSNFNLHNGVAKVRQMLNEGLKLSLGTDLGLGGRQSPTDTHKEGKVISRAVETLGVIPVYPVRNLSRFSNGQPGKQGGVFRDCILVRPGTTVREFAKKVHPEIDKHYLYAETVGYIRLGENDIISEKINIISFKTSAMSTSTSGTNSSTTNTTNEKKK
ncbi:hypothetical protein K7432_013692 [Basidiobolus ranarum]|uniref:Amidohydrolase-related domain-containing protein n=1 Tax=Basidiobolus ranarum TaxID=34480 RepID=A0ABR2VQH3_9FUNG